MTTTFKPKPWEEVKDLVAGKESYDYDTIAYDRLEKDGSRKNLAGIVAPKPISQMTIGELNDWQEAEMRNKSRAYGLNIPGRQEELRRQGFRGDPGSTGVGRYQFEKSTLVDTAKDLYGDEYRNVKFDPDTQEKLASHLYYKAAQRGPEALGNTWHALRGVDHSSPAAVSQDQIQVAASKPAEIAAPINPLVAAAAPATGAAIARVISSRKDRDSAGFAAGEEDIGTLGQYRGRTATYSSSPLSGRNKLLAALQARAERQQQKQEEKRLRAERMAQYRANRVKVGSQNQKVAEDTVRFKDLRKKIFEQIIMNEEKE